ncbi:hypothetical protein AYL99_11848 [Fonsecaea erecta]|uniref:Alpha/beta hydrolase fold-3 domain-containing protein n=1 Tax=Fonsecaea erecta TaxID=1367422 RepID=A0A178Z2E0_9EURO|nr:hypothetical protein AYL99_11848 [Fonsecaea erecta]OAP53968.1 hypothetical protein AYL99_11848 [Fonsecaea erecta]
MSFSSPLSPALGDEATGLTREEYKIKALDGTEMSLWRIATRSAAATETPKPALLHISSSLSSIREVMRVGGGNMDLDTLNRVIIDGLGTKPLHDTGIVLLTVMARPGQPSPFSGPVADVYAAYEYAVTHADDLRIQPHNIAMSGQYTSGQFVWSATHIAIELGLPAPCGVMVLNPDLNPEVNWETKLGHWERILGFETGSLTRLDEQRERAVHDWLKTNWDVALRRIDFTLFPDIVRKYTGLLQLPREDLSRLPPMFVDVGYYWNRCREVRQARAMLAEAGVEVFGFDQQPIEFEQFMQGDPGWYRVHNGTRLVQEKRWESKRQFFQKIWKN